MYVLLFQKEGVKVFVLLYKELEIALTINSHYSKHALMGKHENIKVPTLCSVFLPLQEWIWVFSEGDHWIAQFLVSDYKFESCAFDP